MSEAKHTPGPWSVEENGGNHWGMRKVIGPAISCVGFTIATDVSAELATRIEADAHLIAAAPDLLESLEIIASWDEAHHKLAGEHQASLIDIIDSITAHARRTIAKVKST